MVKAFHTDLRPALQAAQAAARAAKASRRPALLNEPCPECGQPLSLKRSQHGDFIGCTGFPTCRYARPLPQEQRA